MMDRNVRSFDISSPIEMYQFATFMLRLRKWSDNALAQLVEEHLGTLNQSEQKNGRRWSRMKHYFQTGSNRKQRRRRGAAPHNDVAE
ncbi:hypothetical protein CPB85DRAFT_606977 [Mucidula mucida]|nr:hypothetical protein CPB85DRAFT_606977 [Mucidula mucida]